MTRKFGKKYNPDAKKMRKDNHGNVWIGRVRFTKAGIATAFGLIGLGIFLVIAILFGEGTA